MRVLFYLASILPLRLARIIIRGVLKIIPFQMLASFKITHINIQIAFEELSDKEQLDLAKRSFVETVCSAYETMFSLSRPPSSISKNIVRVDNRFLMSEAFKKKDGLILSGMHNKSIDMLLQWVNCQTATVGLYKPIKNKFVDVYVRARREQMANKIFPTSYQGVKELFKAISKKQVILMASDQVPKDGMGEYALFFNREAYTTTLIPSLATKTGKTLIYCALCRGSGDSIKIIMKESSGAASAQSMNSAMEEIIKKNPEDYSWEYKRFKKPPEGTLNPYNI